MKNKVKLLGIVALVAVVVFSMVACGDSGVRVSGTYNSTAKTGDFEGASINFEKDEFVVKDKTDAVVLEGTFVVEGNLLTLRTPEHVGSEIFAQSQDWYVPDSDTLISIDGTVWVKVKAP